MAMNSSTHTALLFVFLWSTSFIALQFCSPHVEPATFVILRASSTAFVLYLIVTITRSNWPKKWIDCVPSVVVGILMHAIYGGGVFAAIHHGLDLTLCALILSLQPIVTVILSALFLKEQITLNKILGISVGFLGVTIMILDGNATSVEHSLVGQANSMGKNEAIPLALGILALLSISSGSIVQKKFGTHIEPLPGAFIQFISAVYFMIPFALAFESLQVNWVPDFVFGLSWLVVVVSLSASTLLMVLIKNDKPSAVANLFYLMTPLVAIQSCLLFGKGLSFISLAAMMLCMSGVFIVNFAPQARPRLVAAH